MSHPPTVFKRPYGISQCMSCVGCRFVLGKRQQTYFMCERKEPRYPVQPQLSCRVAQPLPVVHLKVMSEGQELTDSLRWVAPLPKLPLTFKLGEAMTWRQLGWGEGGPPEERNVPSSALLWSANERGEEGRLLWTAEPQRGRALAWSERALRLSEGALLILTR